MFDVNHNAKSGNANSVVPSNGDEQLLKACEGFDRVFDTWKLLMKEADQAILPCENITYADVLKTKQQWQWALAQVRSLPARNRGGLEAKRKVLGTLSHFSETGDPTFVQFAVELVDEYHRFILEKFSASMSMRNNPDSAPEGPLSKVARRLNLHNIFGIFTN